MYCLFYFGQNKAEMISSPDLGGSILGGLINHFKVLPIAIHFTILIHHVDGKTRDSVRIKCLTKVTTQH